MDREEELRQEFKMIAAKFEEYLRDYKAGKIKPNEPGVLERIIELQNMLADFHRRADEYYASKKKAPPKKD